MDRRILTLGNDLTGWTRPVSPRAAYPPPFGRSHVQHSDATIPHFGAHPPHCGTCPVHHVAAPCPHRGGTRPPYGQAPIPPRVSLCPCSSHMSDSSLLTLPHGIPKSRRYGPIETSPTRSPMHSATGPPRAVSGRLRACLGLEGRYARHGWVWWRGTRAQMRAQTGVGGERGRMHMRAGAWLCAALWAWCCGG